MSWVTPKTNWANGNLVAASDLNDIGNNLAYLKAPPTALYNVNQASDYTTTSTSFVDVDGGGTELELTITPTGPQGGTTDVLIGFSGAVNNTGANKIYLDVAMDGVRLGGDDGILATKSIGTTGQPTPMAFTFLKQGVQVGSAHTFKLQWKADAGTNVMYAGAGTSGLDLHPQFWVREAS